MKSIEQIAREKKRIRIIVGMQKLRAPIMKLHGKTQIVLRIDEDEGAGGGSD